EPGFAALQSCPCDVAQLHDIPSEVDQPLLESRRTQNKAITLDRPFDRRGVASALEHVDVARRKRSAAVVADHVVACLAVAAALAEAHVAGVKGGPGNTVRALHHEETDLASAGADVAVEARLTVGEIAECDRDI